jgi:hypothetical protein
MRLHLSANFEGRLQQKSKSTRNHRESTWSERINARLSAVVLEKYDTEKRFFGVGDVLIWRNDDKKISSGVITIGTVESTTVYAEQDADENSSFDIFLKVDPSFQLLQELSAAADSADDSHKPVLIDSSNHSCRCQLQKAPATHVYVSLFGFKIKMGPWEVVRQANACLQLLLMSVFPAIDTISDLMYILDSKFANSTVFGASVFFLTSQFWLFVHRLYRRRVFHAHFERRIELNYVRGLWFWPKWASPDNLFVFLLMLVPLYFIYFVVFPVVWFFVGYALYSFQLFPISRISNRWLYAFVCVCVFLLASEADSCIRYSFSRECDPQHRKRFDTSDAIILPMVQKGKVEETILESVPQLTIQLINAWMLDELGMMQPLAIFSIALSVFSLSNTVWYYGYWNLFRCMPIRDVPCALALYNYKLHGVSDGELSFSISMQKIKISPVEMSSVGVKVVDLENDPASCTGHAPDYAAARTEESANDQDVTSDGGAVAAAVAQGVAQAVAKDDEISRLKQEKQEKDEEISRLKQEKDEEISRLKQEKDDEISRLKQEKQDMEKQLQISDGRPALAGEDEV